MLEHNLVLKSDELYLVGDSNTDGSGELATGLYARDTRHLNTFGLRLNGHRLKPLSARILAANRATITDGNVTIALPDGTAVSPLSVAVEQRIELGATLRVTILVHNFSGRALPLTLDVDLAADFRDLFDIRGFPKKDRRGRYVEPHAATNRLTFAFEAPDGLRASTEIAFDRPATIAIVHPGETNPTNEDAVLLPGFDLITRRPTPPVPPHAVASFATLLASGEAWPVEVTIDAQPATGRAISALATLGDGRPPTQATIATDNWFFNRFLRRCADDLAMLQTSFPEGSLPAAGIPWYVAPFGRDSLIVGLQTFHLAPGRAAGTLRVLAALQGDRDDPWRDEEPGKILHEVRYGEMARRGEIPHTPYFGTVDATPLFVLLFAEVAAWTGDARFYTALLPNVRRALDWVERHGDLDGDGFVEYQSRSQQGVGIVHQGWKDSLDSLHHPDGRPASGAIALVEVQGYVFAAYRRLADVAEHHGDQPWAAELRGKAEALRARTEAAFWLEEEGFYAQALDGDKTPVAAISSNPGHLLYCGLPSLDRAARVAERFAASDLDSGWGLRTLSSRMATYNPMSYHNGSVWPHDNSLIAAGLRAYGHADLANHITVSLFAAGETDPLARIPELYCGFARARRPASDREPGLGYAESDAPVAYPVSCSPQAWAAGACQLLVRTMLGLRLDLPSGCLLIDPALPYWLNEVALTDLQFLDRTTSLSVRRDGDGYDLSTDNAAEQVRTAALTQSFAPINGPSRHRTEPEGRSVVTDRPPSPSPRFV